MSKKCTPLWREAHFQVKMLKTLGVRTTFGRSDLVSRGRRKGLCTVSKVSKTWGFRGFCSISKNDGRRGTFEEDLQRCISRGRRNTRDMFIRDVRRSGRWFPERGCILEHQIGRFPKMILRVTGAALRMTWHWFFVAGAILWTGGVENRTTHWYEAVSAALIFPFLKEVSQNCFVFHLVKFKNWRSLAELLRFGCSQVQKLRRSRRIASFWLSSTLKNEEVSQNCFVFDVVNFEKWRSLAE